MNWKTGLVRSWIAVSLLWIIFLTIYLLSDDVSELAALQQQQPTQPTIREFVAFIIGPPIALFVLGFAVRWIIAGFRQKNTRKRSA